MTKQRIEYIDAIRGWVMLCVIFGHIRIFSFSIDCPSSFIDLLIFLELPIFFFISGIVCNKAAEFWTLSNVADFMKNKGVQLLLPAVVFMALGYFVFRYDISTALLHPHKQGYWFTLVLFEFFVFYVAYQLL